tara:strand:+ start:295 stop:1878 length:1584 start_codon:yes stop_codon:yes gene_type:complete
MNIFQELKEKKVLDKDGKVDALGPYGRQKLTGREVSAYFKKNKVRDAKIKKAVEVALDLGGAMSVAQKEIKKFYGSKILNSREVKHALKFANESFESNRLVGLLDESLMIEGRNLMPDINDIVSKKQHKKVGGVTVDMFTASMISQIYDKVNDNNKKKMEKANIHTLVDLAMRMMRKAENDPLKEEKKNLEESPDKALKKKAEKTGMPFGILKQVFQRGVKAWQSGHRPGTNAVQWGHARVNSFVTKSKGTWGGADKDLAAKVQGKSEEIEENYKDVIKMYPRDRDWKKLITKHRRHIDAFRSMSKQKDLPRKVEDELIDWALENGEISQKDEVEDFIDAILNEGFASDAQRRAAFASGYKAKGKKGKKDKKEDLDLDEGKMGQLLMDIQQGATAKEIAKDYKIPLSAAKDFLKDYYMNKRNNRKAYESVMDSYRNMIVEKKEMNPKVIEKIAKLTDRNDHNESLLLLAKELKDREAVKLLGNIKDMHKVYGHMPKELIDLRNKVFDNLMRQSKSKFANHSDVYGAL